MSSSPVAAQHPRHHRVFHTDFSTLNASITKYLNKVKGLGRTNEHHKVREQESQLQEIALLETSPEEQKQRRKLHKSLPRIQPGGNFRSAEESFHVVESADGRVYIPVAQYQEAVALYMRKPSPRTLTYHGAHHIQLQQQDLTKKYEPLLKRIGRVRPARSVTPRFGG